MLRELRIRAVAIVQDVSVDRMLAGSDVDGEEAFARELIARAKPTMMRAPIVAGACPEIDG